MRSAGEALAGRRCERFGERIRQRPHRRGRRASQPYPCLETFPRSVLKHLLNKLNADCAFDAIDSDHSLSEQKLVAVTVGSDAMSAMRLRAAGHLADAGQPGPRLDVLRGDPPPCRVAGRAGAGGRRAVRSQPKPVCPLAFAAFSVSKCHFRSRRVASLVQTSNIRSS